MEGYSRSGKGERRGYGTDACFQRTVLKQDSGQDGVLSGCYLLDMEPRGIGDGLLSASHLRDGSTRGTKHTTRINFKLRTTCSEYNFLWTGNLNLIFS